jgi:hypothetical protein
MIIRKFGGKENDSVKRYERNFINKNSQLDWFILQVKVI